MIWEFTPKLQQSAGGFRQMPRKTLAAQQAELIAAAAPAIMAIANRIIAEHAPPAQGNPLLRRKRKTSQNRKNGDKPKQTRHKIPFRRKPKAHKSDSAPDSVPQMVPSTSSAPLTVATKWKTKD